MFKFIFIWGNKTVYLKCFINFINDYSHNNVFFLNVFIIILLIFLCSMKTTVGIGRKKINIHLYQRYSCISKILFGSYTQTRVNHFKNNTFFSHENIRVLHP